MVLAGRAVLKVARLYVREAAKSVELVTTEKAAFLAMEAAARMGIPTKEEVAIK